MNIMSIICFIQGHRFEIIEDSDLFRCWNCDKVFTFDEIIDIAHKVKE